MQYFNDCHTIDQVKGRYKTLAKQYHPDCGGSTEQMQQLNAEYLIACSKVLKHENLTANETEDHIRMSEEYRAVIEKLMPLEGISIEVVGNWIWVTGNTYPVKKQLRDAGMFYASKKIAWYYRSEEHKTTGSKKTLDEIRDKYGSEKVKGRYSGKVLE
jgi:hypothetical protein